jgi:hypothetical protein
VTRINASMFQHSLPTWPWGRYPLIRKLVMRFYCPALQRRRFVLVSWPENQLKNFFGASRISGRDADERLTPRRFGGGAKIGWRNGAISRQ